MLVRKTINADLSMFLISIYCADHYWAYLYLFFEFDFCIREIWIRLIIL